MSIAHRFYASAAAAAAFATCAVPAAAEGWHVQVWENNITIRGDTADDFTYEMYTLNTTDTDVPGIMFSCSERFGLNLLYSFKGVDFMALMNGGDSRRLRSMPIYVWTGDEKRDLEYYMIRRKDKVMSNQKATQSAAAMRALLRNQKIRIKASGYFDVTLDLPPLDESAAQFLEVCPVANSIADKVRSENSSLQE